MAIMKELTDLSVFAWTELPKPGRCWGMEFYLHPARRSYRLRSLFPHASDMLLRLESICEVDLLPTAHYMRRHAPVLTIEYVKEGSLLVRQRGKGYELESGELFLMLPGYEGEFLCGASGCKKQSMLFSGKLLNGFLENSGLAARDVMKHPNPAYMERLFQQANELTENNSVLQFGRNSRLAFEILQSLLEPPDKAGFPDRLNQLLNRIDKHPEYRWNQGEMAKICGCSGTHLGRLFRHYLQTSPCQYLRGQRMEQARRLLAEGQYSVKEIAAVCGFNDAMNFSTAFRARFGLSPRAFRRQLSIFHSVSGKNRADHRGGSSQK